MKKLSNTSCRTALVLSLMGSWQVFADDKPTSLSDAQAAVEANLRTPESKDYDERLGREFMEKHLATMKRCKQIWLRPKSRLFRFPRAMAQAIDPWAGAGNGQLR